MKPQNIVLWTWCDSEHAEAIANNMCDCSLNEWKTRLASSMEYLEQAGIDVQCVTIGVQEMLQALADEGLVTRLTIVLLSLHKNLMN